MIAHSDILVNVIYSLDEFIDGEKRTKIDKFFLFSTWNAYTQQSGTADYVIVLFRIWVQTTLNNIYPLFIYFMILEWFHILIGLFQILKN